MKKQLLTGLMVLGLTLSQSISAVAAAPAAEPLTATEASGLQLDNLTKEFTKLDETKVTSTAQGKPKVLMFFSAGCYNCRSTISGICNSSWISSGIADIVAVDMQMNAKTDVESFKASYGSDEIAICYDEGYSANSAAWDYVYLCGADTTITFPLIFYIDANNKVRGYSNGLQSADTIKERITAISTETTNPTPDEPADPEDTSDETFADVPSGAWYAASVNWAYENGVMNGTGNNQFNPSGYTDRSMVVQILYNISGKPSVSTTKTFTDVSSDAWYANAVNWAASTGVTSGISATEFAPERNVTRQEVAVFLYQYAKRQGYDVSGRNDLSSYSDSTQVASWAAEAMQWANNAGIINGKGTTNPLLDPTGTATRAEIATMMKGFMAKYNY